MACRLADPAAFGGSAEDAFDVVVPSLPGFAFSSPLTTTGVDPQRIATLWLRLMRDVLGYRRFGAAGGDWGAMVTGELALAHADHLAGIYLTLPVLPGLDGRYFTPDMFAPDEAWMPARRDEAAPTLVSHITVHSNDPQTLAYALADSPVGTAAWLWERRRAWSDCDGDLVAHYGRDFLCTNASLYWLTNTIGSSLRIYKECFNPATPPAPRAIERITVPTALRHLAARAGFHAARARRGALQPAAMDLVQQGWPFRARREPAGNSRRSARFLSPVAVNRAVPAGAARSIAPASSAPPVPS